MQLKQSQRCQPRKTNVEKRIMKKQMAATRTLAEKMLPIVPKTHDLLHADTSKWRKPQQAVAAHSTRLYIMWFQVIPPRTKTVQKSKKR